MCSPAGLASRARRKPTRRISTRRSNRSMRFRNNAAWAVAALVATAACHAAPKPASAPALPAPPASPAFSALARDIDAILTQPALEHSYWGVLVKSLKSGDTLYALNPRKLMMPASNMKIVTLAAAAERLGWDYTYETQVFAAGEIESGVLRGDLIVVGSGDPSVTDKDA